MIQRSHDKATAEFHDKCAPVSQFFQARDQLGKLIPFREYQISTTWTEEAAPTRRW